MMNTEHKKVCKENIGKRDFPGDLKEMEGKKGEEKKAKRQLKMRTGMLFYLWYKNKDLNQIPFL